MNDTLCGRSGKTNKCISTKSLTVVVRGLLSTSTWCTGTLSRLSLWRVIILDVRSRLEKHSIKQILAQTYINSSRGTLSLRRLSGRPGGYAHSKTAAED